MYIRAVYSTTKSIWYVGRSSSSRHKPKAHQAQITCMRRAHALATARHHVCTALCRWCSLPVTAHACSTTLSNQCFVSHARSQIYVHVFHDRKHIKYSSDTPNVVRYHHMSVCCDVHMYMYTCAPAEATKAPCTTFLQLPLTACSLTPAQQRYQPSTQAEGLGPHDGFSGSIGSCSAARSALLNATALLDEAASSRSPMMISIDVGSASAWTTQQMT